MGRQGSGPLRSKWRWHVALWIPNIFTYIRIAALVKAFSVAFTDKNKFTALYSVCFVANELSRSIAHFMKCSSTFGDVLAHVSSRASNTGLLIVLSHLYKRDFRVFVLLLELDIVSHWFRIYCEVMSKRCPCLHLHLYQNSLYRNPLFRLFCALSQETMYMTFYLISFDWMEHGHLVKLEFLRNKDHMHSKYFKSLVMTAPGYLIRQIATLDETLGLSIIEHDATIEVISNSVKVQLHYENHIPRHSIVGSGLQQTCAYILIIKSIAATSHHRHLASLLQSLTSTWLHRHEEDAPEVVLEKEREPEAKIVLITPECFDEEN